MRSKGRRSHVPVGGCRSNNNREIMWRPNILLLLLACVSLTNCVSYESLVNYGDKTSSSHKIPIENAPKIVIQPYDVLSIKVFASDAEAAEPFNIITDLEGSSGYNIELIQLNGYLVDESGQIDFPTLGKISLKNKTIEEAKTFLLHKLKPFLNNPVVNIRHLNFKVTVSGEVLSPGTFTVFDNRISLPEALSLAGDLSDYANRESILIVREQNGERSFHRVNLLSANLFQSEYFYLKQNDLVYVEPVQAKTGAVRDQTSKTIPVITAAATLIAVIVGTLIK